MRRLESDGVQQNSAVSIAAFSLGLMLTSATQLRAEALAVGAGEVVLLAWAAVSCAIMLYQREFVATPVLRNIALFWTLAFSLLIANVLLADSSSLETRRKDVLHDLMAFSFVAIILISYVAPPGLERRVRRTASAFIHACVISLVGLALISIRIPVIGPMRIWYWDRFTAWAENPNQLALLLCGAPIVAGYLAVSRRGAARVWYIVLAVLSAGIGAATKSDAVQVGWLAGGALIVGVSWWRVLRSGSRSTTVAALAYVILPLLFVAFVVGAGATLENGITTVGRDVYANNNQGSLRLYLWTQGFEAFARSPILGYGPGPQSHLATNRAIEAHNTFIDWASAVGIFGFAAYVALLGWVLQSAWRSRSVFLLGGWVSLVVFSVFHYVMRQPVYWFYLIAIATFAAERIRAAATGFSAPRRRASVPPAFPVESPIPAAVANPRPQYQPAYRGLNTAVIQPADVVRRI